MENTTAAQLAKAIGVAPRTRRYVLRDADGLRCEGRQSELVLAALGRCDITPDLSAGLHRVAYALFKSVATGRMAAEVANRICELSPYQVCAVVARVARECPETTIGGICETWLPRHQRELVKAG